MSTLITLSTQPLTRIAVPGAGLDLVVLDSRPGECSGIDMDSGAFVRGHWPSAIDVAEFAAPYRVGHAVIGDDDAPPDPSRPEAVPFTGPPEPGRRISNRRMRTYLEALMAPTRIPLLGFLGPSIRFWQMSGTHPSLSLLRPTQGPQLLVDGDTVRARFEWDGLEHSLVVSNERARSVALGFGAPRCSGDALATALGYRPRYLLISLTKPQDGYCHKAVGAILPKP